jgi:hypothetical protein
LNDQPVVLKSFTISGLPLEDIPFNKIFDLNGIVYQSYQGEDPKPACFWSAEEEEFGGYFRKYRESYFRRLFDYLSF